MSPFLCRLFIFVVLATTCFAQEVGVAANGVVALVDGTPILRQSLDDLVEATAGLAGKDLDTSELRRDALQSLIELELLYRESQAQGIEVSEPEIDAQIERSKDRFASPEAFRDALRRKGITIEQLRRDTRKTLAVEKLLAGKVWRDLGVTDEEIEAFYRANREQFALPAQVRARHILIKVDPGAGPETKARARERIQAMWREIRGGRDFAEVARFGSEDTGTARHGGDLGYFSRGEMLLAFEDRAFAMTPEQLSEVFETELGFHILEVTDTRPVRIQPLDEVEDQIRPVLLRSARQRARDLLAQELRSKASIEIFSQ